jgi:hypothetical protein
MREFSMLVTLNEAAGRLNEPALRVLRLVRAGRLRIAGQTLDGRMLFREHDVERLTCETKIEPEGDVAA